MITAYRTGGEAMLLTVADRLDSLPADIVWLDLLLPARDEDAYVESLIGMAVPPARTSRTSSPRAGSISRTRPST